MHPQQVIGAREAFLVTEHTLLMKVSVHALSRCRLVIYYYKRLISGYQEMVELLKEQLSVVSELRPFIYRPKANRLHRPLPRHGLSFFFFFFFFWP